MFQRVFYCFIFCIYTPMYAEIIYANYDVSYGIFGKIGTAKAVLKKENKTYKIDIQLEATGLAKLLSQGRKEAHSSSGHIYNGVMVSDRYSVQKSHGKVSKKKVYHLDHKKKIITKTYSKYIKGKRVRQSESILDFYATNDLLTLYFNLDNLVTDKQKAQDYVFKAVGAERQKGKVTLHMPTPKEIPNYKSTLGEKAAWYATAIIHQKIFSSKEGRLMLAVDEEGIANQAVLKDVIFFGDIRAERQLP